MNTLRALAAIALTAVLVSGCFLLRPAPEAQIIGRWQTELGGFPVVVEYTATTVAIDTYPPVAYTIDGDVIRFEFEGTQSRRVAFPAEGEMVQTDLATGIARSFVREAR